MSHKIRVMYIEYKGDGITGHARIGRVTFSKTGRSLYYKGKRFARLKGFKANYFDAETGERYWVSGCKKDGTDALYSNTVEIDEDVREEYWTEIRRRPDLKGVTSLNSPGKYSK
ncbi:MAG: 1-deoxy-D-xylulose-5-phosphate synthase [Blastocatellia bacterium]